jgi:hypothetical protein
MATAIKSNHRIKSGSYNLFGEVVHLFEAEQAEPVAIHFDKEYTYLEGLLTTQIRKDHTETWIDYIPGMLTIASHIECRISSPFEVFTIDLIVETN